MIRADGSRPRRRGSPSVRRIANHAYGASPALRDRSVTGMAVEAAEDTGS